MLYVDRNNVCSAKLFSHNSCQVLDSDLDLNFEIFQKKIEALLCLCSLVKLFLLDLHDSQINC
jgi:hypothetical protein